MSTLNPARPALYLVHPIVLARMLRERLPDPAPQLVASETDFVRYVYAKHPALAQRYVSARLLHVLDRLDDPMRREGAGTDGPIALGAYVQWRELCGEDLPAWAVTS